MSSTPVEVVKPSSIEEVISLVQKARRERRVIRAVGAGHSWSRLVPADDGYIVDLDLMTLADDNHAISDVVKLDAGIRLKHIGPLLAGRGLAMSNLGAITAQSLAGAVSTGTHGTGLRYGTLGTQVVAAELVDGKGQLRSFTVEKDPEAMSAVRLSLGCLGILVSLSLKCVDAHMVELKHFKRSLNDCIDSLESLYKENERVRIYWFPGSDEVFINTMNRTDRPDDKGPVFSWFESYVLRKRLMGFLWSAGRNWPSFVDELNRFQEIVGFNDGSVVGPSYEAITTPIPPEHQECEVAVPLKNARAALNRFREVVKVRDIQANVPSEIRFVKGDDMMISPCNMGDVCYIGAYTAMSHDADELFSVFCEEMSKFEGRPHWGKIGAPNREQAKRIYPKFDQFAAMRSEFDPEGVFANDYIRELFAL